MLKLSLFHSSELLTYPFKDITICGDPFTKDADHVPNGVCYQNDDVWSLWLGLSGMLVIQGRVYLVYNLRFKVTQNDLLVLVTALDLDLKKGSRAYLILCNFDP